MTEINPAITIAIEDRIAVLTFDDRQSKVNTWNDALAEGFWDAVAYLRERIREKEIDGVIIISGKERNFHAGADLSSLEGETRLGMIKRYEFFHCIMNKIASLKVPTLAAVNGHALGGGLELALACDYRIVREFEKTQLGLPEIAIGKMPCYGGTQRLPRLIGLSAVPLMMEGNKLTAKEAFDLGIADRCVPESADLLTEAKAFMKEILSGTAKITRKQFNFDHLDADMKPYMEQYFDRADAAPAAKYMLRVIENGLPADLYDGLEAEKEGRVAFADAG